MGHEAASLVCVVPACPVTVDRCGRAGGRVGGLRLRPPPPPPPPPCPGCKVYLTFDDGPSVYTPQILSELEAKGVPATFFVLGERAVQFPSYVQRENADGHGIGDHTWDHPDLTTLPPDQIRQELESTAEEIANLTGTRPTLWRPPFGAFNDTVTQIASSLGLSMRLWDVNPPDFTMPGTDVIVSRVVDNVSDGAIILLHDGSQETDRPLADRCSTADDHRPASRTWGCQGFRPGTRLVGTARTLRYVPNREDLFQSHGGGYNAQKRLFDSLQPGEVLVMEARGDNRSGTLGDILALRARHLGAAGIVTDGGVRDLDVVTEIGVPTYHAGAAPGRARHAARAVGLRRDDRVRRHHRAARRRHRRRRRRRARHPARRSLASWSTRPRRRRPRRSSSPAWSTRGHPVDGLFPMNARRWRRPLSSAETVDAQAGVTDGGKLRQLRAYEQLHDRIARGTYGPGYRLVLDAHRPRARHERRARARGDPPARGGGRGDVRAQRRRPGGRDRPGSTTTTRCRDARDRRGRGGRRSPAALSRRPTSPRPAPSTTRCARASPPSTRCGSRRLNEAFHRTADRSVPQRAARRRHRRRLAAALATAPVDLLASCRAAPRLRRRARAHPRPPRGRRRPPHDVELAVREHRLASLRAYLASAPRP